MYNGQFGFVDAECVCFFSCFWLFVVAYEMSYCFSGIFFILLFFFFHSSVIFSIWISLFIFFSFVGRIPFSPKLLPTEIANWRNSLLFRSRVESRFLHSIACYFIFICFILNWPPSLSRHNNLTREEHHSSWVIWCCCCCNAHSSV